MIDKRMDIFGLYGWFQKKPILSGEYIEHEQRGFEARRDQQILEVLVAAVVEKLVDDLLRVETKR